jgi:hypothetical protein
MTTRRYVTINVIVFVLALPIGAIIIKATPTVPKPDLPNVPCTSYIRQDGTTGIVYRAMYTKVVGTTNPIMTMGYTTTTNLPAPDLVFSIQSPIARLIAGTPETSIILVGTAGELVVRKSDKPNKPVINPTTSTVTIK